MKLGIKCTFTIFFANFQSGKFCDATSVKKANEFVKVGLLSKIALEIFFQFDGVFRQYASLFGDDTNVNKFIFLDFRENVISA